MHNKIDPDLRARLRAREQKFQVLFAPAEGAPAGPAVDVLVHFTGDIADLTSAGFEKRTVVEHKLKGYKIATGRIALDRLEELAAIPHVVEIEGPRRYRPALNYTLPDVRANLVHSGHPAFKGNGVVVGVIDSGLDWRHGAFKKDDGSSRILAIWDQRLPPRPGDTSGPSGIGVVYTNFSDADKVRTRDGDEKFGHGTHVAGIAAGNGKPASCCATTGTYVGVAPEATIVGVRLASTGDELGENIHLVEAMDFIFHGPSVGRPAVVNISLGTNRGAHDGTTQVEQAIDAFIAGHPSRAIVVAAGNHADERHHVRGTVPANNHVDIEFSVGEGQDEDSFIELWYDRAGTVNLTVTATGGAHSAQIAHGGHGNFVANPGAGANQRCTVTIEGTINGPFDRNNHFRITLGKPASGNVPNGDGWKLELANPNAAPVPFHCWIERDNKTVFLPAADPPDGKIRSSPDSTISIPATAVEAIAVANHKNKTDCCNCFPDVGIVASSGRGPVARVSAGVVNDKPDIAAPGLEVTAAQADACNLTGKCCSCCPDACCCLYHSLTGTSMAAPHVAGAIALMLEKNAQLTKAQILQHLQASARPRPAGESRDLWGAGSLDAKAAVDAVPAPPGGGGGGGPAIHRAAAEEHERGHADERAMPPALRIVKARLKAVPEGPLVAYVISRNFSEVRRLINSNRRIATLWHRSDGPAMLRRLINGAIDEDAPAAILSAEQFGYLERWLEILQRYGSPRLKESIVRCGHAITELLLTPLAAQAAGQVEQPA